MNKVIKIYNVVNPADITFYTIAKKPRSKELSKSLCDINKLVVNGCFVNTGSNYKTVNRV